MIKIELDNISKKVILDLSDMPARANRNQRIGLAFVGRDIMKKAQLGIKSPPKTGRIYRRNGRNRKSSAEGQYPANQTGTLRRSLGYEVEGIEKVTIGSRDVEYSKFLEEGTRNMRQRPFLENTIIKNEKKIEQILDSNFRKTFK